MIYGYHHQTQPLKEVSLQDALIPKNFGVEKGSCSSRVPPGRKAGCQSGARREREAETNRMGHPMSYKDARGIFRLKDGETSEGVIAELRGHDAEQECGHYQRFLYVAETDGTNEIKHCALCEIDALRQLLADAEAERDMFDAAYTEARKASLEEASQAVCKHCADGLLFDEKYKQHILSNEYGTSLLLKCSAIKIRALISGVGLHASQQPHATDAASAPRG